MKGHKRAECPNKVASVKREGKPKCRTLEGKVGTSPCTMTLDSGADHTVVRADLVAETDYTGRSSRVGDYYGCWRDVPTADVWIGIEKEYLFKHEVLVVPQDCPHEVLLGNDLVVFDELYQLALVHGNPDPQVKAVTRAKAKTLREEEKSNQALDARDGAQPSVPDSPATPPNETPTQSGEAIDSSREDAVERGEPTEVDGDKENLDDVKLDGLGDVGEVGDDIPLLAMAGGEEERSQLIEEQSQDASLEEIREWAKKNEKGYSMEDGLLVHTLTTPAEQVQK